MVVFNAETDVNPDMIFIIVTAKMFHLFIKIRNGLEKQ